VRGLESKHVLSLRDKYQDKPAAANNLLRCLSSMLGWSIPRGWRTDNPCLHVKKLKGGEGYAPWTWEQITYFRGVPNLNCGGLRRSRFIRVRGKAIACR